MLQSMRVELPLLLYQKLEKMAKRQNRSIVDMMETVVERVDPFSSLPATEAQELDAMVYLSNDSLWGLAQRGMTPVQRTEWQVLNEKGRETRLSIDEAARQAELLALYDYVVLRRAVALRLLQQRGCDISPLLIEPE